PGFVSVALVGHLDSPYTKEYVDAAAFSMIFLNLSATSIGFGLASALDTLGPQAVGARKLEMLGVYFHCALIILGLAIVPMMVLNYNASWILLKVHIDEYVAQLSGEYSQVTMWMLPPLFLYEIIKKTLQANEIVNPMMYIATISNISYCVVGYIFCYHTNLGFLGAAYARVLSNSMLLFLALIYLQWNPVYREWWPEGIFTHWSRSLSYLWEYTRFGIPALLMLLMESWAFEVSEFMSGWLPNAVVATSVHSGLISIAAFVYSLFLGISVATSIRVGNSIGEKAPDEAKTIAIASYIITFVSSVVIVIIFYATRSFLPTLFINDPISIANASYVLGFVAIFEMTDAMSAVAQGICRGLGWQSIGAIVNAIAYYVIGIPLGAVFGFWLQLGVEGLWIGLTIGVLTGFITFTIVLTRANWSAITSVAQ
ncbi:Multidrug/Oligosaccharidyl-lipid/Polysaccharide (MOP) Flippase Superfamily, partial [Thraustotheca clavata]